MARLENGTADQEAGMEAPLLPLVHSTSDSAQPASCLQQCWREVPRWVRSTPTKRVCKVAYLRRHMGLAASSNDAPSVQLLGRVCVCQRSRWAQ